jgi:hypothetical protein
MVLITYPPWNKWLIIKGERLLLKHTVFPTHKWIFTEEHTTYRIRNTGQVFVKIFSEFLRESAGQRQTRY